MAWNEPGGNRNNDRDPWSSGNRGGNDQGPPDLDEALKKGLDKLNRLFGNKGGSGGSGGSGSSGGQGGGGFGLILAVVGLLVFGFLAWQSVYIVDERENGVVLRFGEYHKTTMPGLNFKIPLLDDVRMVTVTDVRSFKSTGHMLTEDENIVSVNLGVQYRVQDPKNFVLNVRDPSRTLQYATDSALRHEVGSSTLHGVLTERRAELGQLVEKRLQRFLDTYTVGMQILRVNVESTQPPEPVQEAFRDVQRAREDMQRFVDQAEQYRNRVVPEARGQAERIREDAKAYRSKVVEAARGETARFLDVLGVYEQAPEVTASRLYIDTMQQVLTGTSKVVVDIEKGNNLMMLPLDQMMKGGAKAMADDAPDGSGSGDGQHQGIGSTNDRIDRISDQVIDRIRDQQNSNSGRERR
ncbi:FtsH protease activity modulator HflK [Halospina sp. K52047b]|uniref:FtsH protease activity modulator HflK n=1 Tax=Halospina sp. K52047b TaxID=2614160 RepID=UPI00124AAE85|nr:FtsH protease activity modulator HflK [Halospina sp. K52047b]KAA8979726.1 FtsH protease activity modulator HflK [Halospina sp. K52047b]